MSSQGLCYDIAHLLFIEKRRALSGSGTEGYLQIKLLRLNRGVIPPKQSKFRVAFKSVRMGSKLFYSALCCILTFPARLTIAQEGIQLLRQVTRAVSENSPPELGIFQIYK